MKFQQYQTLNIEFNQKVLTITLNRPDQRNAMNTVMVGELMHLFTALEKALGTVRAVILKGSNHHFCAGGDIKDFKHPKFTSHNNSTTGTTPNPKAAYNRRFGELISLLERLPMVTFAAIEGYALGGGLGLNCVCDISLAVQSAQFGMPETQLGLPPAQILPFVSHRIGLMQARKLALLGQIISADEAKSIGLIHQVVESQAQLDLALTQHLAQLKKCAPYATAITKHLLLATRDTPIMPILDQAANLFADAIDGHEGQEGAQAFLEKRPPQWAK